MYMQSYLNISSEVQHALDQNKPIVALESTIISHGMPYPQNFETACMVEKAVRDQGATPATIAIIDSKICIGLSNEQIERCLLYTSPSPRDLSTSRMPSSA